MKRHTDERTTPHTQVRKFQKEEQREVKSKKRGARSFPHKMKQLCPQMEDVSPIIVEQIHRNETTSRHAIMDPLRLETRSKNKRHQEEQITYKERR